MPKTVPFTSLPDDRTEVVYEYGPDSTPGELTKPGAIEKVHLPSSVQFPGAPRDIWIHTPEGHTAHVESAVTFFNDGWWYLDPEGDVRAGTVLDNLAARGDLPPMIGVFVDPGVLTSDGLQIKNRNVEYDAADDRYGSFLIEAVLPLIESRYAVSADPKMRAICGGSSGGNAAFTAAWNRPDAFDKVIAFNASFAQMPGGNPYPRLIGLQPEHNLRVFLQAAHRDLNWNQRDFNWFAENLETAAALARAGFDLRFVVGDGGHSPNHGGVLLPDALRWIWRDTVPAR